MTLIIRRQMLNDNEGNISIRGHIAKKFFQGFKPSG